MTTTFIRLTAIVCSGAASLLGSAIASGESLEEAWRAALAGDLTLRAAEHRLAAAAAELDAARAERLPTVSASATAVRWRAPPAFSFPIGGTVLELPLFAGKSAVVAATRVTVPLYTAGSIRSGIEAADQGRDVRASELQARTRDVKLAVAERFLAVLRAESAADVAASSTASLAAHARDVEDMRASGQVPRNDELAALVSLADAEQLEVRARNDLAIANAAYNRALGRSLTTAVQLDSMLPAPVPGLAGADLDALIAMAHAARAELAAARAAAAALEARARQSMSASRPQLALAGGYTFLQNEVLNREDFWSVGLAVQWDLFAGGRHRDAADALARQARALAHEGADLLTAVELEVRTAWLRLAEARQRERVTEGARAQAEENLRVVRDRYRNGEGTNSEVLDAEALRAASASNFDSARYDEALGELALARAVGAL